MNDDTPLHPPEPVRWRVPELELECSPVPCLVEEIPPEDITPPTLEEIEAIRQQAQQTGFDEGFNSGKAAGSAQGQAEMRRLVAQMEGIVDSFTRPLARLEQDVARALGELAVRIAGHLVQRAYVAEPGLLGTLVNAALGAVDDFGRTVEVRLHPDDLAVLEAQPFTPELSGSLIQFTPDASLSRGDVRVHADSVRIDGSVSARLDALLEDLIRAA